MSRILETERLLLRPPEARDAITFSVQLFDYEVSKNLSSAPYPYWIRDAKALIAKSEGGRARGDNHIFAIARKSDSYAIGTIGIGWKDEAYTLGYWVGRSYWGCGVATEAGRAIVPFGFEIFEPEEIRAGRFVDNPASGRVLTKLGFVETGAIEDYPSKARGASAPCILYVLTAERFKTLYRPFETRSAGHCS
jgi:[ribosomal protein S5]-alanine N-acetyltransferase